ncbi:MAG: PcfB family protein [Clostridia bacterium]|nr:PcfB family protein [Clostridia bacterium]
MSYSGDAAEQVVRMTLEGTEVAAKITGAGAKQLALLLYAVMRDQKKTKGKIRLTNMLRSGKELKVFAVQDGDLQRFCEEAQKYGVLYCVLKDKNAADGITDIMVRAEDASKINRIFERFKLTTVDMGSVKSTIERQRAEKKNDIPEPERAAPAKSKEDLFIEELLKPAPSKEEQQTKNPTEARVARSRQSEPSSSVKSRSEKTKSDPAESHPSVRQELKAIKDEMRKTDTLSRDKERTNPTIMHQQPIGKNKKLKEKSR